VWGMAKDSKLSSLVDGNGAEKSAL